MAARPSGIPGLLNRLGGRLHMLLTGKRPKVARPFERRYHHARRERP